MSPADPLPPATSARRVPLGETAAIVAAVVAVAGIGGLATGPAIDSDWYRTLEKPSWQPPGAVFGPVWTVLYAMIAASMYAVRRQADAAPEAQRELFVLFGGNLVLNLLWTLVFFRGRNPLAAGIEIIALEATTIALIVRVRPVSRGGALALVPYALWVAFAAVLTWTIALAN